MKKKIGIMGASSPTDKEIKAGYEIGKISAQLDLVVVTGGGIGIMESAMEGAKSSNGLTLAITPTDKTDYLNPFVDVSVVTNLRGGRNYINIQSSDIVVAIFGSNSAGTLSEICFAIQLKKPICVHLADELTVKFLSRFESNICFSNTLKQVEKFIKKNI
jgi:uncharacterized protein (TIGR00725 family)